MLWVQRGDHRLPLPSMFGCKNLFWQTEAQISEQSGVISLSLVGASGKRLLTARLDGYGIKEDNGIPETMFSHS